MRAGRYILHGKTAIPCDNLFAWAQWFEAADRLVAKTEVGDVRISTVFLGLDHNFGEGDPLLFETMIFGGSHDLTYGDPMPSACSSPAGTSCAPSGRSSSRATASIEMGDRSSRRSRVPRSPLSGVSTG